MGSGSVGKATDPTGSCSKRGQGRSGCGGSIGAMGSGSDGSVRDGGGVGVDGGSTMGSGSVRGLADSG